MGRNISYSNFRQTALAILRFGTQKPRLRPGFANGNGKPGKPGKPSFEWSPNSDGKPHWNGLGGMKENLELLGYSVRPTRDRDTTNHTYRIRSSVV